MARFHGRVGFVRTVETVPGVHREVATEVPCSGDVLREAKRFDKGDTLNENVTINNRFSIVYGDVALSQLQYIRYVVWLGTKWKVTAIEVQTPRIILTAGGVYNGITV